MDDALNIISKNKAHNTIGAASRETCHFIVQAANGGAKRPARQCSLLGVPFARCLDIIVFNATAFFLLFSYFLKGRHRRTGFHVLRFVYILMCKPLC